MDEQLEKKENAFWQKQEQKAADEATSQANELRAQAGQSELVDAEKIRLEAEQAQKPKILGAGVVEKNGMVKRNVANMNLQSAVVSSNQG